jgi:hypothetical protein
MDFDYSIVASPIAGNAPLQLSQPKPATAQRR